MNAVLLIQKNGQTIKSQPLVTGESWLGRGEDCVVRLDDRAVSRQHAVVRSSDSGLSIEKKTRLAPLKINGSECDAALLKEGDEILVGPFVLKVVLNAERAAQSQPHPHPAMDSSPVEVDRSQPAAPVPEIELPVLDSERQLDGQAASSVPMEQAIPDISLSLDGAQSQPQQGVMEIQTPDMTSMVEMASEDARTKVLTTSAVKLKLRFPPESASIESGEFDQEEISIGRGKGCDVVLNDKKSSRKHAIIRREGSGATTVYTITDLQSANGTYVNGAKISEHPLSGDDLIRIGDVEFIAQAVTPGYEERAERFLKVDHAIQMHVNPAEEQGLFGASPPIAMGADPNAGVQAFGGGSTGGATGLSSVEGIAGISAGGSSAGSLMDRYRAMPQRTRLLMIAAVGMLVFILMDEEPEQKKKAPPKKQEKVVAVDQKPGAVGKNGEPAAPVLPSFKELTPELQKFVETQYETSMEYFRNRDFDRSLYEIRKIFQYVVDYKDARDLERYSIEGKQRLQAQEEERKRKESEKQIRERVAQLVMEVEGHMNRKEYDRAREFFAQIQTMDPENEQVTLWKKEIQKFEDEKREKEQRDRIVRETNEHARQVIAEADVLRREARWLDAVAQYESAIKLEPTDKKLLARARGGIEKSRDGLKSELEPLMIQAREHEVHGEVAKAFQTYEKIKVIDPKNAEAREGMSRIRNALGEQAKNLYTEGVLAESYSDFAQAKAKFEQIVQSAPKDDPYYERARRKLLKYVVREEPKLE